MGVLGGLSGIGWLLPAGATLIGSHSGFPIGVDPYHHSTLTLSEYSLPDAALSARGRFRTARARTAMLVSDWGPWSLSISASRAGSAHGQRDRIDRRDGFSAYQLGAGVSANLPGGFAIGAVGNFAYLNRRQGPLSFDTRPRRSVVTDAGISIAHGGADRLTLSYVDVSARSGRLQLSRAVELIAGSPRPGHGPRLAFSHRIDGARSGSLNWGFDASAMRMSAHDSLLLGAPARIVDARIALNLDRRF